MNKETKLYSEEKLLEKFNIDDWSDMPIQQLGKFMSLIPSVDTSVACKIIDQFPDFYGYVSKMTDCLTLAYDRTIENATVTTKASCDGLLIMINALKGRLNKDNLSEKEYITIENMMVDATNKLITLDSDNKKFLEQQSREHRKNILALIALGAGGLLASFGFMYASSKSDDNIEPTDDNTIDVDTDDE